MSVAIYLRVSTDKQTTENQEPAVRQLVEARGGPGAWEAASVYRETMSAAKERPAFDAMMEAARLGKFKTLYVWSLDRFGRSMFVNLRDLTALADRFGVTVVSVREGWVEQTADPMLKKLLLAIFGWVAEHERDRLRSRTNAGLDRVRAGIKAGGHRKLVRRVDGTTEVKVVTALGRPRAVIPDKAIEYAAKFREMGAYRASWRETAAEVKRVGLGAWNHATLARECTKRVPGLVRGTRGRPRSSR